VFQRLPSNLALVQYLQPTQFVYSDILTKHIKPFDDSDTLALITDYLFNNHLRLFLHLPTSMSNILKIKKKIEAAI
jgi:hypothetical protein